MSSSESSPYADYIALLVKSQGERKASIEERGISVVTTSGALVSLLFGFVTLVKVDDAQKLPVATHGPLVAGLILFVVAAVLGLATNVPWRYRNLDPAGLTKMTDQYWDDPRNTADLRIASTQRRIFARAQRVNEIKAWMLVAAMAFEVGAVVAVALGVVDVIKRA